VVQRANFAFEDLLTLMVLLQGATVEVQGQITTILLDPNLTCAQIKERAIAAYDSSKTRKQVSFTDGPTASALKVSTISTLDDSAALRSLRICEDCSAATGHPKYHTPERCPSLLFTTLPNSKIVIVKVAKVVAEVDEVAAEVDEEEEEIGTPVNIQSTVCSAKQMQVQ